MQQITSKTEWASLMTKSNQSPVIRSVCSMSLSLLLTGRYILLSSSFYSSSSSSSSPSPRRRPLVAVPSSPSSRRRYCCSCHRCRCCCWCHENMFQPCGKKTADKTVTLSEVYFSCASLLINFVEAFIMWDILRQLTSSIRVSYRWILWSTVTPTHIKLVLNQRADTWNFCFKVLLILWKNSWFCMGLWQWLIHCNNNNNKLPGALWAPGPVMGLIYLLNNNNNNNTLDAAHCEAYVIWATFQKLAVFPLSCETVSLSQFFKNQVIRWQKISWM